MLFLRDQQLLLLGFCSLFQISVLPGYLCLRTLPLPVRGLLQTVIYSFALTLVANYTLVYALYSAGLYAAPIVYGIFALELLALLYLMRKDRFRFSISLPSAETLAQYRELWRRQPILGRVIAVTAFAALVHRPVSSF